MEINKDELKELLIAIIEEEFSPKPTELSQKWEGGTLVLKPSGDQQSKEIPLEIFFKKIISLRESLRVLEQKINNHPQLSQEDKINFESYLTKCYGSLTTFNILFKHGKDRFVGGGSGKSEKDEDDKPSLNEIKRKIGLNEYGKE